MAGVLFPLCDKIVFCTIERLRIKEPRVLNPQTLEEKQQNCRAGSGAKLWPLVSIKNSMGRDGRCRQWIQWLNAISNCFSARSRTSLSAVRWRSDYLYTILWLCSDGCFLRSRTVTIIVSKVFFYCIIMIWYRGYYDTIITNKDAVTDTVYNFEI